MWYAGVVWLGEWVPQMQSPGGPWQRGQQGAWANLKLQICKGGGEKTRNGMRGISMAVAWDVRVECIHLNAASARKTPPPPLVGASAGNRQPAS